MFNAMYFLLSGQQEGQRSSPWLQSASASCAFYRLLSMSLSVSEVEVSLTPPHKHHGRAVTLKVSQLHQQLQSRAASPVWKNSVSFAPLRVLQVRLPAVQLTAASR